MNKMYPLHFAQTIVLTYLLFVQNFENAGFLYESSYLKFAKNHDVEF